MDKESYSFETVELLNRLGMEFKVDVASCRVDDKVTVILCANKAYHRTSVAKNIEQIAFQLKERLAPGDDLSVVEYDTRGSEPQWWQWRFNWVGKTPLDGQRYLLSISKTQAIELAFSQRKLGEDLACEASV